MSSFTLGATLCLAASTVISSQESVDSIRLLDPLRVGPPLELRATGDADSDGDVDLLYLGLDRMQVWFNDGAGEFTGGPETSLPFPNNHLPNSVRFGDVTGDGFADMVVIDLGASRGLHVRPGVAGGGFGPLVLLPTATGVLDFELGDADHDGRLDIVELHGEVTGEHVTWWYWNGASFTASTPWIDTDPGTSLRALEALDLDLDGADDVVVVESLGPRLITLPTVAGSPVLGTSVALGLPASTSYAVVGGDLDGDGDEDVVAARLFSSRFDIQPVLSAGTGAVTPGVAQILSDYDVNSYAVPFYLGDWDSDGDAELLSEARTTIGNVSRPGFYVHENNGSHVFTRRAHVMSDTQHGGAGPADFNADGFLDFASAAGVKFGNGTFHDTLVQIDPVEHRVADWDGDGDLDLYGAGSLGLIGANDGTGHFTTVPGLITPPTDPFEFYGSPILLDDFDGDGRLDYIVTKRRLTPTFMLEFVAMQLLVDDGLGAFRDVGIAAPAGVQVPGNSHGESELFVLGAHDLDGDGYRDILTDGGYWPNDGAGFFPAFVPLYTGRPVAVLDAEGDGDLDVVSYIAPTVFGGPAQMNLLRHDGALGFTVEPLLSAPFLHFRVGLVDLDEDGDTDLTIGTEFQDDELFLIENSGGAFVPGPILTVAFGKGSAVFVEDFDGDGRGDLATGTSEYGTLASEQDLLVFPRLASGLVYGTPRGYIGRSLQGGADVDADGDLDAVGAAVIHNWEFDGPTAGGVRQYGVGLAGSGGAVPVLGASGPLRPGSTSAFLRLSRGLGGAPALLAIGFNEAQLVGVPFPGFTTWLDPIAAEVPIVLGGGASLPGAGTFVLPLGGVLSTAAGATIYAQIAVFDPAGVSGVSSSNGLELRFGL